MKVILLQDIKGTGKKGDVKEVSDGYARNYMIPRGLVKEATKENMNHLSQKQSSKQYKLDIEKEEALKIKDILEKSPLVIKAKSGEEDKLFGSITAKDIEVELEKQKKVKVDKKKIDLKEPIKSLGNYTVKLKLFKNISLNYKIVVENI